MNDQRHIELPPALRALADSTRMKILLMLEGKGRTVSEIVEFFDLSQPTISRHLQTLAAAELVVREKHGREATYRINPERIGKLCVSLAACFPCCCVTVAPVGGAGRGCAIEITDNEQGGDEKEERSADTRSGTKRKKKATSRKGDA